MVWRVVVEMLPSCPTIFGYCTPFVPSGREVAATSVWQTPVAIILISSSCSCSGRRTSTSSRLHSGPDLWKGFSEATMAVAGMVLESPILRWKL